jgi:hypothetical protein
MMGKWQRAGEFRRTAVLHLADMPEFRRVKSDNPRRSERMGIGTFFRRHRRGHNDTDRDRGAYATH